MTEPEQPVAVPLRAASRLTVRNVIETYARRLAEAYPDLAADIYGERDEILAALAVEAVRPETPEPFNRPGHDHTTGDIPDDDTCDPYDDKPGAVRPETDNEIAAHIQRLEDAILENILYDEDSGSGLCRFCGSYLNSGDGHNEGCIVLEIERRRTNV